MSDTPPDLTPEQVSPEPAPKKRIIRKTKSAAEAPVKPQTAAEVPGTEQDSSPAPRKRTIRKKVAELADDGMESVDVPGKKTSRKSSAEIPVEEAQDVPARPRRGRPRKKPVEEVPETDGSAIVSGTEAAVKPVRRRAAKAVAPENGDSAGPEAEIAVHAAPAEPASDSSDSVPEQPAEGRPKVIRQRFVRKPREQEPEADASVPSIKVVQEGAADFSEDAAREPRRTSSTPWPRSSTCTGRRIPRRSPPGSGRRHRSSTGTHRCVGRSPRTTPTSRLRSVACCSPASSGSGPPRSASSPAR